jgi:hypothetical protein
LKRLLDRLENPSTDATGEIQALRQLLEAVELEGVLVQADALYANRPFSL